MNIGWKKIQVFQFYKQTEENYVSKADMNTLN